MSKKVIIALTLDYQDKVNSALANIDSGIADLPKNFESMKPKLSKTYL